MSFALGQRLKLLREHWKLSIPEVVDRAALVRPDLPNAPDREQLIHELEVLEAGGPGRISVSDLLKLARLFRVRMTDLHTDNFNLQQALIPVREPRALSGEEVKFIRNFFEIFFRADGYGDNYSTVGVID